MGYLMSCYDVTMRWQDIVVEEDQDFTPALSRTAVPSDTCSTVVPFDHANAIAKLGLKGQR